MLTQNSALRLYRLPKTSQLLRRLGEGWHQPTPKDPPLPMLNNAGCVTTLRTLVARVPADGPRISQYPTLPHDAPQWNGRVETIPKKKDEDYDCLTEAIVNACLVGNTMNIFCEGVVSNRDHDDMKQLGAASAILYHKGKEFKHIEEVYRETITERDTRIRSLSPGLKALTDLISFQTEQNLPVPKEIILIFLHSAPIMRMLDASLHEEQGAAINHMNQLGEILQTSPTLNIKLLSLPRKIRFVGFRRAKQLVKEAIHTADLSEIRKPRTIRNQKAETEVTVITKWAERWYQSPWTLLAYQTALTKPPNGKPHPTFQYKKERQSEARPGQPPKAKSTFT